MDGRDGKKGDMGPMGPPGPPGIKELPDGTSVTTLKVREPILGGECIMSTHSVNKLDKDTFPLYH